MKMNLLSNLITPQIKKGHKIIIIISLIIGVLISTFVYSIQNGMHHVVNKGYHTVSIAIAISHLKYGLTGFRAYQKIDETLKDNGMPGASPEVLAKYKMSVLEIFTNAEILNNAIMMALNVDDVSHSGRISLVREDIGIVIYHKLS